MESEPKGRSSLFRQEALDHLMKDEEVKEPLRVSPPWTWHLFIVLGAALGVALLVSIFGKVEVQNTGRGILRPQAGVRLMQAQIGGVLGQTWARSGDVVRAGQAIARIDSAQMEGALLETERQLQLLRSTGQVFNQQEDKLILEQLTAAQVKLANQENQVKSYEGSVKTQEKKVEAVRRLLQEQLVASINLDEAVDQLNAAIRMRDAAKQQLVELQHEVSSLKNQRERSQWQRVQELSGTQSKRDALDSTLRQTHVVAPVDGFLEAFVARPGDLLVPGQTVAKLIPEDSPLHVVAFLAEKDRAFVKSGDTVLLELESYPFTEFGTVKGYVVRISSDLASPHEVQEALGEGGRLEYPAYRVEIQLTEERPKSLKDVKLRAGMLLNARFTLRRQRLITVVLEPLRRWLE